MRRLFLMFLATCVAGIVFAPLPASAGKNDLAKWKPDGFACVINNGDGTSVCRFDVDVKNRQDIRDLFICKVVVKFDDGSKRKAWTGKKWIRSKEWKHFHAMMDVPVGVHVAPADEHPIRWKCLPVNLV